MRDTKTDALEIHLDRELRALIKEAVRRCGLRKSEVVRQGLRKGLREIVRARNGPLTGRTLVHELLDMKGLEIPDWRTPRK
jgi:Arc/MetJ-type ribon-helix-helix transcriptional regulator